MHLYIVVELQGPKDAEQVTYSCILGKGKTPAKVEYWMSLPFVG